ncbi:5'/3'-nucleotidase SurE [Mastigocoleus sp. MO_188.B34]|uniref:5'/3'-nucleotidase SurE n=1 Tax=Mastigocoleus sp. MO_188.B34 TaxID=3036635 RepID=UPI0026080F8F|nr:5'/3'-nucleotidase SurE [Mastigocoleus sp. MO_188.B34]MDJ0696701.1 5'/3'-nucleotidase SurE [Mastigocoleus sp. MO_188.B34]
MTFILTNDDGIDAPGIQALYKAVNSLPQRKPPIIVAAPKEHHSGCGHRVTTNIPIQIQNRSENEYAISGTPADCIRVAVSHISQDIKYVLSGINAGGNMGVDTYISGTVAAVREAAMHGVPGIAISQYKKKDLQFDWDVSSKWTAKILVDLLERPIEIGSFWNVNLPHLSPESPQPEVIFCESCTKPLPINYHIEGNNFYYTGEYAKREKTPNSDVDVCFSGKIAVTRLRL